MPDIILTCIKYGNVGETVEIPTLPAEISVNGAPAVQSYKIMNIGSVKFPKGNEVDTVSWDSYFFNTNAVTGALYKNTRSPLSCVQALDQGRQKRAKWRFMCTEYGLNMDVFIAKFDWKPYNGYGHIKYSIELDKWVDLEVHLLGQEKPEKDSANKLKSRSSDRDKTKYTVKAGDTLSKIAREMTGDSKNWQNIYSSNKSVIESTASKYRSNSDKGHWIYPGTTLNIPQSTKNS